MHQVILVSGFCRPYPFPLIDKWFNSERIDIASVKEKAKAWSVLHTRTDPMVPFAEGEWLAKELGVPLIEVKSHWGHLVTETGALDLPEILEAIIGKSVSP
jgi:predicted alpha/beta hydrolase family esterase